MPITEIIDSEEVDAVSPDDQENVEIVDDPEDGGADEDQNDEGDTDSEEEFVVSVEGDEEPVEPTEAAPQWVKELRASYRQTQKEKRALEDKVRQLESGGKADQPEPLGKKPTLEDFDYDTDKFEAAYDMYQRRKFELESSAESIRKAREQEQQQWQQTLDSYNSAKQKLKLADYEDAEGAVFEQFSQTQQGIILSGSANPALLFYVIGKSPERVTELAKIKDPVKFTWAIAQLETKVKSENKRKSPPAPETRVKGDGSASMSGTDHKLDRLRAAAEKSGDYTEVTRYKRALRK